VGGFKVKTSKVLAILSKVIALFTNGITLSLERGLSSIMTDSPMGEFSCPDWLALESCVTVEGALPDTLLLALIDQLEVL
jgi:hypothetical protein